MLVDFIFLLSAGTVQETEKKEEEGCSSPCALGARKAQVTRSVRIP